MIKRIIHKLLGYKVEVTFPDGGTEITRAYLSSDCTVRVNVWGNRQCYLEQEGVVRGLWPNADTKWKVI